MQREYRPRFAIALISAAVLAYEVLLMALFSLVQWHHFAYLVVSIALLGFGVSGSLLVFGARRLETHYRGFATGQAILFALAAIICFAIAQRLSFNPEELIWDRGHWLRLALVMLLLMLPFLFAANLIGLTLIVYRQRLARIYAADLLGAGVGALAIIALMFVLEPAPALRVVALTGVAAAAVLWLECGGRWRDALGIFAAAVLLVGLIPGSWIEPRVSPYKELSQLLQIPGTRIVEQRFSPLGRLSVVESPTQPLRHAPGLSLNARQEPPPQLALFSDADGMSAITAWDGDSARLAYLDAMTSALPYHVQPMRRVLLLGAGGGADLLQALYHDSRQIDAVEINPQVVDLVANRYGDYSGGIYRLPGVRVFVADARGFLQREGVSYDLIQVPLLDSRAGAAGGVHGLNENFIYTVDALAQALSRLEPGGILALTRWIRLPPRDSLKLFATAAAALERNGSSHPGRQLALIRGLQTSTLLIRNGSFERVDIERIKTFCRERAFDLAYYPDMPRTEANRVNRLDAPYFHDAAVALLGPDAAAFKQAYKFDLEPASDDRPFHHHFARLSTLGELLELRQRGGGALIETGYLTLLLCLGLGLVLSLILILAPLLFLNRSARSPAASFDRAGVLFYFAALGLGFLLIEISFLQKFILLLQHPIYAAAVVLATFLTSAGLGSAFAQRYAASLRARRITVYAILLVICCGGLYLLLLGPLLQTAGAWPLPARIGIAIALIAPLGFAMGMPFPLGLAAIQIGPAGLIPWAWGINGCFSVISAVLASLLAIHLGFNLVILIAMGCYLVAAFCFPQPRGGVGA